MPSRERERSVLLAGMMGAGKSSVGRALAERLGWKFIDTDAMVEQACGMSVADLFRSRGESAFRALERRAVERLPAERSVIALGGGALMAPENRAQLRERGTLVWLEARPETLATRLDDGTDRPLLADLDRAARVEHLRALGEQRAAAYAEAAIRVSTDERGIEEVCRAILGAIGLEGAA